MSHKPLKILAIPALVALSLVVATSAHSLARTQDSLASKSLALSQAGRTTLVVWHVGTADTDLHVWTTQVQAQYARTGLAVQPLASAPADVRSVHRVNRWLGGASLGLMVFDANGELRVSSAMPDVDALSATEVAIQALLNRQDVPAWVGNKEQIKRHIR